MSIILHLSRRLAIYIAASTCSSHLPLPYPPHGHHHNLFRLPAFQCQRALETGLFDTSCHVNLLRPDRDRDLDSTPTTPTLVVGIVLPPINVFLISSLSIYPFLTTPTTAFSYSSF